MRKRQLPSSDVYIRAETAAKLILGPKVCAEDPLAWWLLIELLLSFGNAGPHHRKTRKPEA